MHAELHFDDERASLGPASFTWCEPETTRTVLAAVDVVPSARAPDMARCVVRAASDLARRANADLYLVHAWTLLGDSFLSCPVRGLRGSSLTRLRRRTRAERRTRLDALLATEASVRPSGVILEPGRPGRAVRRVARRIGADVLVMGTFAPPPLPGFVLGEMAEALAGGSDYSILLVRDHAAPAPSGSGHTALTEAGRTR